MISDLIFDVIFLSVYSIVFEYIDTLSLMFAVVMFLQMSILHPDVCIFLNKKIQATFKLHRGSSIIVTMWHIVWQTVSNTLGIRFNSNLYKNIYQKQSEDHRSWNSMPLACLYDPLHRLSIFIRNSQKTIEVGIAYLWHA